MTPTPRISVAALGPPQVLVGYPPNYARIVEVLGPPPEGAIFTYGARIYCRSGQLDDHLLIHENVHRVQQVEAGGPEPWWEHYLADREFRLAQELEAYRTQLRWLDARTDRTDRRSNRREIAKALAHRMYGRLVTERDALELLR